MTHTEEQRYLALFWGWLRSFVAESDLRDLRSVRDDPPDFAFTFRGSRIALEHTSVFKSPTLRNRGSIEPLHDHAIKKRITDKLQGLLRRDTRIPPVIVSIHVGPCDNVKTRCDEKGIAEALFALIRSELATAYLPLHLYLYQMQKAGVYPPVCEMWVCESSTRPLVVLNSGFCRVDEFRIEPLREAAESKAKDLLKYQARFDECWLLLASGTTIPAGWFPVCAEARELQITDAFDRVFLVDDTLASDYVTELMGKQKGRLAPGGHHSPESS